MIGKKTGFNSFLKIRAIIDVKLLRFSSIFSAVLVSLLRFFLAVSLTQFSIDFCIGAGVLVTSLISHTPNTIGFKLSPDWGNQQRFRNQTDSD